MIPPPYWPTATVHIAPPVSPVLFVPTTVTCSMIANPLSRSSIADARTVAPPKHARKG